LELLNPNYIEKIQKLDVDPVFIVGSGRSGTTVLARLLHESGCIHFAPENFTLNLTYLHYLKCINEPWENRVNNIIDILANQDDSWRWDNLDIDSLRAQLLRSSEQTLGNIIHSWYFLYGKSINYPSDRWGCKTPNMSLYSRYAAKIYPNSIFIHIFRNPYDVIISFAKTNIVPYNRKEMSEVLWYSCNLFLLKNASSLNIIRISYEGLVNNVDKTIYFISKFIGLCNTKKKVEYNNPDTKYNHLNSVNNKIQFMTYQSRGVSVNKRVDKLNHILESSIDVET